MVPEENSSICLEVVKIIIQTWQKIQNNEK